MPIILKRSHSFYNLTDPDDGLHDRFVPSVPGHGCGKSEVLDNKQRRSNKIIVFAYTTDRRVWIKSGKKWIFKRIF